jgi:hypothetical protein
MARRFTGSSLNYSRTHFGLAKGICAGVDRVGPDPEHSVVDRQLPYGASSGFVENPRRQTKALATKPQQDLAHTSQFSHLGVGLPFRNRKTPLAKDNCWTRWIKPRRKTIDLDWVNFQVMRRTHSSLMRELEFDPKIVADQLGHSVDVNLNVYSKTSLRIRKKGLDSMESAVLEA